MRTSRTEQLTLLLAAVAAAVFVLLALVVACRANEGLPVVEEQVDRIAIVQSPDCLRVIFVRHGQVLATRHVQDEMLWSHSGGVYRLTWNDYGTAERVVTAPRFSIHISPTAPCSDPSLPWWAMQRNMRDLKQP